MSGQHSGYKTVTDEAIIKAAPEVVVMMTGRGEHEGRKDEILSLPALALTPGGKTAVSCCRKDRRLASAPARPKRRATCTRGFTDNRSTEHGCAVVDLPPSPRPFQVTARAGQIRPALLLGLGLAALLSLGWGAADDTRVFAALLSGLGLDVGTSVRDTIIVWDVRMPRMLTGIVVPHLLRLIQGPNHRSLLPNAALLGAIVLLLADLV